MRVHRAKGGHAPPGSCPASNLSADDGRSSIGHGRVIALSPSPFISTCSTSFYLIASSFVLPASNITLFPILYLSDCHFLYSAVHTQSLTLTVETNTIKVSMLFNMSADAISTGPGGSSIITHVRHLVSAPPAVYIFPTCPFTTRVAYIYKYI